MSLLLEALKKAELAKQGKKPAEEDARPAESPAPLTIELEPMAPRPEAAEPASATPIITRSELPDISQTLEIFTEDLPSASTPRPAPAPSSELRADAPRPPPPPAPPPETAMPPSRDEPTAAVESDRGPARAGAAPADEARQAARQLFEAKEVEYNPKRNFYITIGVLLAAGAGYGGYVWWQLQPKSVYNAAAVKPGAKAPPPSAAAAPPPPAGAQAPAQQAAPAQPGPPTAAPAAPAAPPAATAAEAKAPDAPRPAAVFNRRGARAPEPERQAPAAVAGAQRAPPERAITVSPPALVVDPRIEQGYDSFQRGDIAAAREAYLAAAAADPLSRDALLGLAAVDIRTGNLSAAEVRYMRLLELDPRDIHAIAGLTSLRGPVDPEQSESRLKTLIAAAPDAAQLHFALGNLYARQERWPEAQGAYFRAYSGEPRNADFAFNLAVSLDHLRQKAPALQYYQRALALAAGHPIGFSLEGAQRRVQELAQTQP